MDVQTLRREFPVTQEYAYLNHAAHAPLPARTVAAMENFLHDRQHGPHREARWETLAAELRMAIADLINAHPEEIALVTNTAEGINLAAHSLPLQPGDNVIFCNMEYPANVYPWMNLERLRGIEVRILPHREGGLAVDDVREAMDKRTKVVAASTVEFLTGFRNDIPTLGELCREQGVYFVVDGIQSLGAAPLDVRACHIDFLACGGPKWLMGPAGQGFLYCRRELLAELQPPFAGALSVVGAEDYRNYDLTFLPDAGRFHLGTYNLVGMVGLLTSIRFLMEVGIAEIERWTLHLTDVLIDDLQRRGYSIASCLRPEHRSAIVSFDPGDVEAAYQRLTEARVVISRRENYIRVSPHCYNTEEEMLLVGDILG